MRDHARSAYLPRRGYGLVVTAGKEAGSYTDALRHRGMTKVRADAVVEAVKAAPPAGYLAGVVAGWDWGTVASILACAYTAWLLGEKVWKAYKSFKEKQK